MRGLPAWCLLGSVVAGVAGVAFGGGCLDIPAHQPCGGDDRDCDGWPAIATNPAAADCDDGDAAINPGASDDPMTAADEDCIADGTGVRLFGVTGNEASWTSGALTVGFGSTSRMPMNLRIGGADVLGSGSGCPITDEEGMGVSLYPAFAAHLRSGGPVGDLVVERRGPAMATSRVTWSATIPASGAVNTCATATTLSATVRFTVLPGQRLIRDDQIDVSASVSTCAGCGTGGAAAAPLLTSYLTLAPSFDRAIVDGRGEAAFAEDTLDTNTHTVCMREMAGNRHVAVTWRGEGAGIRLRSTGSSARALVYDLATGGVGAGQQQAITAMIVDGRAAGPCDPELLDAIGEVAAPPEVDGVRYVHELGTYQPIADVDGALTVQALETVRRGLTLRAGGLGDRGVTVWRQPGGNGAYVRLARDWNYLTQRDDDGATVVFLPSLLVGDRLVVASPGREPAP